MSFGVDVHTGGVSVSGGGDGSELHHAATGSWAASKLNDGFGDGSLTVVVLLATLETLVSLS